MLVNLRMYGAGMVFCVGICGNIGTSLQQHLEFTEPFSPAADTAQTLFMSKF